VSAIPGDLCCLCLDHWPAKLMVQYLMEALSNGSLVPWPLPPRGEARYTLRMHEIFCHIFCKKLRVLPCPYAEDYTNQEYRAFYYLWFNLQNPAGILFRRGSVKCRKVTNRFTKKGR